ncbi:glucosyltransferase domain-containing protein [Lysinibacillus louembei]|uniref:Glucosyltransferase domain-containing protein n=1 Tax=Lysinibacillus louembei TaxID=1470088 RepID=A0ABZ0RW72_9BACI|nr:glucosyltransferase domain-containing protein [Lysinibacillus louembei]WPK12477.1 glucosyltransferase domain-containing protein [Lysinibacillus louembei]
MAKFLGEFNSFYKQKNLIYPTIFLLVLCYGYEIINFTLSIDEEKVNYRGDDYSPWFVQGRIGIGIIKWAILNATYIPYLTTVLAAVLMAISALIWVFIINKLALDKLSSVSMVIFIGMYLALPSVNASFFSFSTYNLEIALGMLIVPISIFYIIKSTGNKQINIFWASAFLAVSLCLYQAFITVFILGIIICLSLLLYFEQKENIKKFIFNAIVTFSLGLTFFYLTEKLFQFFWPSSGYVDNFIRWGNAPLKVIISDLYREMYQKFCNLNILDNILLFSLVTIVMILILILIHQRSINEKCFLLIIFLTLPILPFSLCIVTGNMMPYRTLLALPLFVGFVMFFLIHLLEKIVWVKHIFIIIVFLLLFVQIQSLNMIFYGDNVRYKMDENIGNSISEDILTNSKGDLSKPVVFIGEYSHQLNPRIIKFDTLGASFFEWDNGNNVRIHNFLRILGYKFLEPSAEMIEESINGIKIDEIPNWPVEGSIIVNPNYIIVKLSNPSGSWYYVNLPH